MSKTLIPLTIDERANVVYIKTPYHAEFKEAFNAVVKELLTDDILTPEIIIDAELDLADLTPKYLRVLKQFAPFGPKNMRPVFVARGVELASVPRIVGKNHLRMKVKRNGLTFDCIGFGLDYLRERIEPRH